MATMLGGPNSRQEAKILALSWACEISTLAEAIATAGERILQIDFHQFLHEPSALFDVFRHFGVAVGDGEVRAIHAAEIHRGLAWLECAASKWPVVGRAMTLGQTRP
jgi:hypothetical protein